MMAQECIICGRPLKTGLKYCYVCRSLQHARQSYNPIPKPWIKKRKATRVLGICFGIILYWIFYLFGLFKGEMYKVLFQMSLFAGIPLIILVILRIMRDRRNSIDQHKPLQLTGQFE